MRRHHRYCFFSGKEIFPSVVDARLALRRLGNRGSYYRCTHCGGWHITHMSWDYRRMMKNRQQAYERTIQDKSLLDPLDLWRLVSRLAYSCIYAHKLKSFNKPHKHGKTKTAQHLCAPTYRPMYVKVRGRVRYRQ